MKLFSLSNDNGSYVELCSPLKVYYDITNQCNLNCIFCYKGKSSNTVQWEQAKEIIQKVSDSSIPDLVFLGGEPMCCTFLFEALRYAKELGINPGIITNGTLFTEANTKQLKKLVNNSISVSVHAPNDELHDYISRGEHTHSKILNGLKLLNQSGIVPELSFTPIKENVPFLFDTIDGILSKGIKISDLLVNRLIPFGNALEKWKNKKIDLNDQILLLAQMERLQNKYPEIVITTGDALPFCVIEEKYWKFIARCDYAITLGWINDRNLFGKCMVRGCTNADSLDKYDLMELWKTSDSFLCHRHMENLNEECLKCDWLLECGGGCACSGIGTTNQDVLLGSVKRHSLPPHNLKNTSEIKVLSQDLDQIHVDDVYLINKGIVIRKERLACDITDENYLFLPASNGAIIQDIITPKTGKMLWINEIEKQIITHLKSQITIADIVKSISYEFYLSRSRASYEVKATITKLTRLGMVQKK